MKKIIFALMTLVSFSLLSYAQDSLVATTAAKQPTLKRLAIGLRGAADIPYGGNKQYSHTVGGEGLFDLQYDMYWHHNTTHLGFLVGLSAGYQQTGLKQVLTGSIAVANTDGGEINYATKAVDIQETKQRVDLEVPIMFALVADNGVFFNVGPRFSFPVWNRSRVECSGANISAYFPVEGVEVSNEKITGKASTDLTDAEWNVPKLTIKLGLDLGYEFQFENLDALDLGIYCDWTGLNIYSKKDCTDFVQVLPPSSNAPAKIIYNSPSDPIANKLGGVNVGLKLTYQFHLEKKSKPATTADTAP